MRQIWLRLVDGLVMALTVGCQDSTETKTVTPDDMFMQRSEPVGSPSSEGYRREPSVKLMDVPAGPTPEQPPAPGQ